MIGRRIEYKDPMKVTLSAKHAAIANQIGGSAATVASGVFLANVLDPNAYGKYATAISLITILSIIPTAGIPQYLAAVAPKFMESGDRNAIVKLFSRTKIYMLLMCLLVAAGFVAFESFNNTYNLTGTTMVIISSAAICRTLLTHTTGKVNSLKNTNLSILLQITLPQFFLLVISYILWQFGNMTYQSAVTAFTLSFFLSYLIGGRLAQRRIDKDIQFANPGLASAKVEWREIAPFSIVAILSTINSEVAIQYSSIFEGASSTAQLRVALQSTSLLGIPIIALTTYYQPRFSHQYHSNRSQLLRKTYIESAMTAAFISIPILLMMAIWRFEILSFLFGTEYREAATVLIIILTSFIPASLFGTAPAILMMTGRVGIVQLFLIVSLGLNVIALIVLGEKFGLIGVAIAHALGFGCFYFLCGIGACRAIRATAIKSNIKPIGTR